MNPAPAVAAKTRASVIDDASARAKAIAAAGDLFYARGIQSVGMDTLSRDAGIGLKRLYQLFPSKEAIVEQVLAARHEEWTTGLDSAVRRAPTPRDKLLAIFDFLGEWSASDGFRGCVFINSFGELGGKSPRIAEIARAHKQQFQHYLAELAADAGAPAFLAPQLALLAEGAQTTAAISGADSAADARAAAVTLIDAALGTQAR